MFKKIIFPVLICLCSVLPSFAQNIWMDAMKGSIPKIEKELVGGFDINSKKPNSGYTLLAFAVAGMQYKTVEFLMSKGANADIKNDEGNTPLGYAIGQNKDKMVKLLIDKGAGVNVQGRDGYPLLVALSKINVDYNIVEMLYNAGADITVKDGNGDDFRRVMFLRKDKKKIEKLFATPPAGKAR